MAPAYEVRVAIEDVVLDTSAISMLLYACHGHDVTPPRANRAEVPDNMEQLDWESWSWDALHELSVFEDKSIVDHLTALAEE